MSGSPNLQGYFSNMPAPAVSNAIITVSDGSSSYTLQEDANQLGNYLFPEEFIANREQNYEMNINLEEEVGGYSNYNASAYMPRLTDKIDSVSVVYNTISSIGWYFYMPGSQQVRIIICSTPYEMTL